MKDDPTEAPRKARIVELNESLTQDEKARLEELQRNYGRVWTTAQLREEFVVLGFMAPYVVARNLKTGKKGSLEFTHLPRFYFNWEEDK